MHVLIVFGSKASLWKVSYVVVNNNNNNNIKLNLCSSFWDQSKEYSCPNWYNLIVMYLIILLYEVRFSFILFSCLVMLENNINHILELHLTV